MKREHFYYLGAVFLFILLVCLTGCDEKKGHYERHESSGGHPANGNYYLTNDAERREFEEAARNAENQRVNRDHFRNDSQDYSR